MGGVPCTSPHHTRVLLIDPLLRLMGTLLRSGPELLVIEPMPNILSKLTWGKSSHAVISLKFDNVAQETIVFIRNGLIMSIMSTQIGALSTSNLARRKRKPSHYPTRRMEAVLYQRMSAAALQLCSRGLMTMIVGRVVGYDEASSLPLFFLLRSRQTLSWSILTPTSD
jgi:hypothetical protein